MQENIYKMLEIVSNISTSWYLTIWSSLLCVLGCMVIFIDDVYYFIMPKRFTSNHPFNLDQNSGFLKASLGFGSGSLIFTALFRLLPEALEFLQESLEQKPQESVRTQGRTLDVYLIAFFVAGMIFYLILNLLLHVMTSQSVVHCAHDTTPAHDNQDLEGQTDRSGTHHDGENWIHRDSEPCESLNQANSWKQSGSEISDEMYPLLKGKALHKKKSFIDYLSSLLDNENLGECKGYSLAHTCICKNGDAHGGQQYCEVLLSPNQVRIAKQEQTLGCFHNKAADTAPSLPNSVQSYGTHMSVYDLCSDDGDHHHHHPQLQHNHPQDEHQHHHHHVNTPLTRLFLVGVQTTLAIALHKFPEGFIMFVTSEANEKLGLLIFLSLVIHNFTEGFLMSLPLYYQFSNSRWGKLKALAISGSLGGLSQPIGALMGMYFFRGSQSNVNNINFIFGNVAATTSGFLTMVGLTMYANAITFAGNSINVALFSSMAGMCLMGVCYIFTGKSQ